MNIERLFLEHPTFETERLHIRKLGHQDAVAYYAWASDPLVSAATIWERHTSVKDSIEYLNRVITQYETRTAYHWGIVMKETGMLVGRVGFINFDPVHERAELGYALASSEWGRGIMTEAAQPLLRYAFQELNMHRIEARCNADNPGSARVLDKLGMRFEGILRKQLKIKGVYTDQRMYARLAEDGVEL